MIQNNLIPEECDIETFINASVSVLKARLGSEYRFEIRRQMKNNSTFLSGIVIGKEGESVSPTVYVDDFYKSFLATKDFSKVAETLVKVCCEAVKHPGISLEELNADISEIKQCIYFRLINAEKNAELLRKVPHRMFLDCAVVYHRKVSIKGDSLGSILITDDIAEMLKLSEDELYMLAVRNTPRLFPVTVKPMYEMLAMLAGVSIEELPPELKASVEQPMFVVSNTKYTCGACCMLYPEFRRLAGNRLEGDFYILPSSIHELIIVPADAPVRELLAMVREVNSTQVPPEDFLSDNVYRFCHDTGDLEMILNEGDRARMAV